MISIGRLVFALTACLLLNSCGLISTALRLAPYLLLADENSKDDAAKSGPHHRGRLIEERGDLKPRNLVRLEQPQQMASR